MEQEKRRAPAEEAAPSSDAPLTARQKAISEGLQKLFYDVVSEPVPEELIRLLKKADKRGAGQ